MLDSQKGRAEAELASLLRGLRVALEAEVRRPPLGDLIAPLTGVADADGYTALHDAALSGDAAAIRALISDGAGDVNAETSDGFTPALCAAAAGSGAALAALVQGGANVPTSAQIARVTQHGGAGGGKWSELIATAFVRPGKGHDTPWSVPVPYSGSAADDTNASHIFSWEVILTFYSAFLAAGGTPLTNAGATSLCAFLNTKENLPLKYRSSNAPDKSHPNKYNDHALDIAIKGIIADHSKLGALDAPGTKTELDFVVNRIERSISLLAKASLGPESAEKFKSFVLSQAAKYVDPRTGKPVIDVSKLKADPTSKVSKWIEEKLKGKLTRKDKTSAQLGGTIVQATAMAAGPSSKPSAAFIALRDALIRDGWTSHPQVARADASAWAVINRVEGRHVGGPVGGGGASSCTGSSAIDSLISSGWATQAQSDAWDAANGGANAPCAANNPAYKD